MGSQSTVLLVAIVLALILLLRESNANSSSYNLNSIAFMRGGSSKIESDGDKNGNEPEILEERTVYERWRKIVQRKVRMRNGKVVEFDLVSARDDGGAVLIFAWNSTSKTATLIREYMPGSHRILWGLAAGMVEEKHEGGNVMIAAQHELEEECHLVGGTWIRLCGDTAMDKYATTMVQTFLVIDPEVAIDPKPLDDEEDIEIRPGVTVPELLEYITRGEMNIVGGWGALLAIQKLREMGEIE